MAIHPIKERKFPRMSANDLALYMVSSETAKLGIISRAKRPQTPIIIRYRDVKKTIRTYLTDDTRSLNLLISAEDIFRQRIDDSATTPLMRDDAHHSIEVLHDIQKMSNRLGGFQFVKAPTKQPKLILSGVEISVYSDVLVHGVARGREQIGAGILRVSMDDTETETARQKRKNVGLYVATLARLHIEKHIPTSREVSNRLCMSIDVQHREVFQVRTPVQ